jgi:hypothetical protein
MSHFAEKLSWSILLPLLTRRRGVLIVALCRVLRFSPQAELFSDHERLELGIDPASAKMMLRLINGEAEPGDEAMRESLNQALYAFVRESD